MLTLPFAMTMEHGCSRRKVDFTNVDVSSEQVVDEVAGWMLADTFSIDAIAQSFLSWAYYHLSPDDFRQAVEEASCFRSTVVDIPVDSSSD